MTVPELTMAVETLFHWDGQMLHSLQHTIRRKYLVHVTSVLLDLVALVCRVPCLGHLAPHAERLVDVHSHSSILVLMQWRSYRNPDPWRVKDR